MNIRTIDSSISSKGAREVLLDEKGDVRILPYSAWASLHWDEVRLMMHEIGLYVAPTEELIDYLDKLIGDNTAIEVGCGLGCVGRELSIPITDSCAQADKDVKAYYSMFGQPTIVYPHDVIRMDAVKAARHFRPHTIIGCYVTHRWRYDTMDGSDFGIDFPRMMNYCRRFVLVGNIDTHKNNPLMALPHEEIALDGLFTRADNDLNRVFVWTR